MDVPDHHRQSSRKRGRNAAAVLNTNGGDARLTLQTMDVQLPVEYEDEDGGKVVDDGAGLVAWQHSSRIYRVSRATGGKDRHSKVLTSKGLRDRRVRLSVSTAIQFYDLQDRLGYDQPSKAVEWLIEKASDAISDLPSLNTSAFPPTPKQASDEKRPEPEPAESDHTHSFMGAAFSNQHLTGSACSSTSETSKGSALSLSRSAIRVKARERARERAAKEKEKEEPKESEHGHVFPNQQGLNNPSTSFTQLLTGGGANSSTTSPLFALPPQNQNADHLFAKHFPHMSVMDDLGGQQPPVPAFFSNFGNSSANTTTPLPPLNGLPLNICTSSGGGSSDHPDQHLQQFSFAAATGTENHHHHHMQVPAAAGNDYNLNFSISSSLTGFNRGTLQSNAPPSLSHHHHHHQQLHKFVSSMDGPPAVPFFVMSPGGTESNQFSAGLDGRLQLYHGDSCRYSDLKGKGKS